MADSGMMRIFSRGAGICCKTNRWTPKFRSRARRQLFPDTAAEFSGECHDVMATSMRGVAALESRAMRMHACTAGERLGCHFLPLPLQTAVSAAAHVLLGPWDVLRMACARQREGSQRGTQRESERFTKGDISLFAPHEKKHGVSLRLLCLDSTCTVLLPRAATAAASAISLCAAASSQRSAGISSRS